MAVATIVIPCHDDGPVLAEAVGSACSQSVPVAVVVVDDGSTDPATRSIIDRVQREGSALVIAQEHRGVSAARNTGISAASTDYVLCLDADDRLEPDSVALLLAALGEHHDVGYAYPGVRMFGAVSRRWRIPRFNSLALLAGNVVPYCALMPRDTWERAGGYSEVVSSLYEDWDFWLSCLDQGIRGVYVPEATLWYRRRPGSALGRARAQHRSLRAQMRERHTRVYRAGWIAAQVMAHPAEVPGALVRLTREALRQDSR